MNLKENGTRQMQTMVFVSPGVPDPEGSGSEQRAYSFLKAYSQFFDIQLWCSPQPYNLDVRRAYKLKDLCTEMIVYYLSNLQKSTIISTKLAESIARADHVHVFKSELQIKHKSVFWDYDELPNRSIVAARFGEQGDNEYNRRIKNFVSYAKGCRIIYRSSDRETLDALGKSYTVPNGYHQDDITYERKADSNRLVFVGNLSYAPNMDAVRYYAGEIAPHLGDGVQLQVVGRRPFFKPDLNVLDALCRTGQIGLAYDVESCTPYYASAYAAAVPLRVGSGTRIKILEAFAHRCPVVTTSKGCEGLDVTDGTEVLIRDDPAAFAQACVTLREDKALAERLAGNGAGYLVRHHSQQAVEGRIADILRERGIV